MKKIIIFIVMLILNYQTEAHRQHVHQYIVREAYTLLKNQIGNIPVMASHISTNEGSSGGTWAAGLITAGAWNEDEEDVVYGYSKSNPPTLTGISGSVYDFTAIFGGIVPDGFVSSTHFWYADYGDQLKITMRAGIRTWWDNVVSFTIPNAYQKISAYANGNWEVIGNTDWLFYVNGQKARLVNILGQTIRRFFYNNLILLFKNGSVQVRNLASGRYIIDVESGEDYMIAPTNGTITLYLNEETKSKIVWEILGRMCHLLQDMSVPAHANIDPHGSNSGLIDDYYESYFGYDYYWNAQNTFSQVGGYINPYQSSNPLHFLMYTTNQMANHFATRASLYTKQ